MGQNLRRCPCPFGLSFPKRSLFERSLEAMRLRYDFVVAGYVVMPEPVHLLVSEPKRAFLGKALQALKLSVSVQSKQRPFWQARYYDFNVFTRTSAAKISCICTTTRSPEGRSLSRENGPGRAIDTTPPEIGVSWRSNQSGRLRREIVPLRNPTSQKRDVGHPV